MKTERICRQINQEIEKFLRERKLINGELEIWTPGDFHRIYFGPENPQITQKDMEKFINNIYIENPEEIEKGFECVVSAHIKNNGARIYNVDVKIQWENGTVWSWDNGEIGEIVAEVEKSTLITAHGQIPAIRGTGKIDFFPAAITEADFQGGRNRRRNNEKADNR